MSLQCIAEHQPLWKTAIIGAAVGPALDHHSRSGPTSPWSAPGSSRPALLSSLQGQQQAQRTVKHLAATAVAALQAPLIDCQPARLPHRSPECHHLRLRPPAGTAHSNEQLAAVQLRLGGLQQAAGGTSK